jgi:hypothetical protein
MSATPVNGLGPNMLASLLIDGKPLPKEIDNSILTIELERTMATSSTVAVVVRDPKRNLAKAGYFTEKIGKHNRRTPATLAELQLDRIAFRAKRFAKRVDEYTLTFEDREIALMRECTKYVRESRAHTTRAQFLQRRVKEAVPHAVFFCPELNRRLPVLAAHESNPKKEEHAAKQLQKGAVTGSVTIEGVKADPDQINNINIVLQVCDALKVPANARLAIVEAGLVEGKFKTHNPANDGSGSDGVFQLTAEKQISLHLSPFDTKGTAEHWLTAGYFSKGGGIALAHSGKAPGEIAQDVEGSAFPERYETRRQEAEIIIASYGGGGEGASSTEAENNYTPTYFFERNAEAKKNEEPEGTYECGLRLAEEINWRFFVRKGIVVFASDEYLASVEPKMVFDETSPGIIDISWEIDKSQKKAPSTAEIECRAGRWQAPPGSPVILGDRDGPEVHEGVWLVSSIRRPDIADNATTITLERPRPSLAEEAHTSKKRKAGSVVIPGLPNAPADHPGSIQEQPNGEFKAGAHVLKVWEQVKWLSKQDIPYVFGGGHSEFNRTSGLQLDSNLGAILKQTGLDCSGSISWALHSAELFPYPAPLDTNGLMHWGISGEGQYMTLWVTTEGPGGGHVYMELNIPQLNVHTDFEFNGPAGTIGGLRPKRSNAGYTPRHWLGL